MKYESFVFKELFDYIDYQLDISYLELFPAVHYIFFVSEVLLSKSNFCIRQKRMPFPSGLGVLSLFSTFVKLQYF